jgi:hypothetical protein
MGIENKPEVTLWILRWEYFLTKFFRFKIIASLFIFYIPIIIIGYALQIFYDYRIFTQNIHVALLWIGIGPFLIENAFSYLNDFFLKNENRFINKDEWKRLYFNEIKRIQTSKYYMIFGIPWGIITSLVFTFCVFNNAPLIIQLWSIISFFILFFVSSIGFCGILLLIVILNNIFTADLFFDIFHPDRFGGFSNFSTFSVKFSLYFSSGSLVFPLAYEAIRQINNGNNFLTNIVYLLSGFYLIALILSFIIPIYNINKFVDRKRNYLISQSWNELNKMINDFRASKDLNLKQGIDISMYYYFHHSKLMNLKDYPWDVKILMEFGLSFVLPIAMGILKIYYQ